MFVIISPQLRHACRETTYNSPSNNQQTTLSNITGGGQLYKNVIHSKKGNVRGQLSKWMLEDGHPFQFDTLYYNHVGKKLPASALEYVPKGEGVNFLPILINVRFSDEGKNHLVGGKI